ncbi:hypothetical protein DAETH_48480 (plasmid) [Deinococcus aetherius]|uniref:Uncharacterized protein n=1 Tax=Deinococcus aetherius TaxID=200252 RepID=A0ABM8AM92_9DEIO|nr:hypothetical protein DAETH_48480 [Deinococcus aetherius]
MRGWSSRSGLVRLGAQVGVHPPHCTPDLRAFTFRYVDTTTDRTQTLTCVMLPSIPEATEQQAKGSTPCGAARPVSQRVSVKSNSKSVSGVGTPEASACAQDTHLGVPGQRAGRGTFPQARVGARA